ncbi:MAG: DMT family transporter, partial [Gammaproteobacteria bacterium]|nr:DMT family transporter [Gammaproteobacteria bacterium]
MTTTSPASPQLVGIGCVLGAVFLFSLQDALIKALSGDYALHEVILARASVAALVLLVVARTEGVRCVLCTARPLLNILRGLFIVVTNMCFFLALASMPLADAVALFFVAPLFITLLSIPILGERVGRHRWTAVLVGMVGVFVMLRPGDGGFDRVALLPLLAALGYAATQMVTRRIGLADRASTMAMYIQVTFICVSLCFGLIAGDGRFAESGGASWQFLLRAWVIPELDDAVLVLVIGLLNAFGAWLMTQAYRTCEATTVAPFEYVALPFSMLWGLLLWGDWPGPSTLMGIGLIIGAGLYVFYREA